MSDEVAKAISDLNHRLTVLSNLLAYQIAGGKRMTEAAPVLRRLGLTSAEIAIVFDSTPATVSVRLAEAKRTKKETKRKPKPEASERGR